MSDAAANAAGGPTFRDALEGAKVTPLTNEKPSRTCGRAFSFRVVEQEAPSGSRHQLMLENWGRRCNERRDQRSQTHTTLPATLMRLATCIFGKSV